MVSARICDTDIDFRVNETRVLNWLRRSFLLRRPAICSKHSGWGDSRVDSRRWCLVLLTPAKRNIWRVWHLEAGALGRMGLCAELRGPLHRQQFAIPSQDGGSHFGCIRAERISLGRRSGARNHCGILRRAPLSRASHDRFCQVRLRQSPPGHSSRYRIWTLPPWLLRPWAFGWYRNNGADCDSRNAVGHCVPAGATRPSTMHGCSFSERCHSFTVDRVLYVQGRTRVATGTERTRPSLLHLTSGTLKPSP